MVRRVLWKKAADVLPVNLLNYQRPPSLRRRAFYAALVGFLLIFCLVYGAAFALFAPYLMAPLALPLAVLGLVVVWALPDSAKAPTGLLDYFLFAIAIAVVAWPNYIAIVVPGLPWITARRLTGFPSAAVFLLCIATSPDLRAYYWGVAKKNPVTSALFGAFVAMQFLTLPFSHSPFGSLQALMIDQIDWTVVFFIALWFFRKPGRVENWAGLLWGLGLYISFIGLLEYKLHRSPWVGYLPSFLRIDPGYLQNSVRAFTDYNRLKSTYSSALAFAEYLALAFPFVLHFAVKGRQVWVRLLALATLPLFLLMIILTDSRLGTVGCFVTLVFYAPLPALRHWREKPGSLVAPAIVCAYPAMFVGAVASTFLIGKLKHAVWGGGAQQNSTDARIEQYSMGIPKVLSNPIGHGPAMSGLTLDYHAPDGMITIDTYYLSIALDYGIIGFVSYFGMILLSAVNAALTSFSADEKDRDAMFLLPVGLSLLNFFIIKAVFSEDDNHSLMFAMLGLVLAVRSRLADAPAVQRAPAPKAVRSTGLVDGGVRGRPLEA